MKPTCSFSCLVLVLELHRLKKMELGRIFLFIPRSVLYNTEMISSLKVNLLFGLVGLFYLFLTESFYQLSKCV